MSIKRLACAAVLVVVTWACMMAERTGPSDRDLLPSFASSVGTPLTVDYPVCTGGGGGGDFSQAAKPGDGTDAVGGC